MDPITQASKRFLADLEASWRARPTRPALMSAEPSYRSEVIKTLRLLELSPDNRRPLFVYEASFVSSSAYYEGLAAVIERDYELVRRGVAAEGVLLPPCSEREQMLTPMERAVLAMDQIAGLLGEGFAGLMVALIPKHVEDDAQWREAIEVLLRVHVSPRVRMGVFANPGISLRGDEPSFGVRFVVDQAELTAFLGQLGTTTAHPQMCPEDVESCVRNGPPCTPEAGMKLRTRLVEGAQATATGEHARAAECYREARAVCAAEGLVLEEALVLMALGGACLVAEAPDVAIESYRKAADLARTKEAWQIECQAWLGVGGACLMLKHHDAATYAYRSAARAARIGNLAILQSEALRMVDLCLRLQRQQARSASALG